MIVKKKKIYSIFNHKFIKSLHSQNEEYDDLVYKLISKSVEELGVLKTDNLMTDGPFDKFLENAKYSKLLLNDYKSGKYKVSRGTKFVQIIIICTILSSDLVKKLYQPTEYETNINSRVLILKQIINLIAIIGSLGSPLASIARQQIISELKRFKKLQRINIDNF